MKLCLIGSTRFIDLFNDMNRKLTLAGHVVYSVATVTSAAGGELPEEQKMVLDLVHLRKIQESDAVVLVTDDTGYFGFSTRREMVWAQMIGRPIMDCRQSIMRAFQEPFIRKSAAVLRAEQALGVEL